MLLMHSSFKTICKICALKSLCFYCTTLFCTCNHVFVFHSWWLLAWVLFSFFYIGLVHWFQVFSTYRIRSAFLFPVWKRTASEVYTSFPAHQSGILALSLSSLWSLLSCQVPRSTFKIVKKSNESYVSNTRNCLYTARMEGSLALGRTATILTRPHWYVFLFLFFLFLFFLVKHWILWRVLGVCGTHGNAAMMSSSCSIPPPPPSPLGPVDCHSTHVLFTIQLSLLVFFFLHSSTGQTLPNDKCLMPFKCSRMLFCLIVRASPYPFSYPSKLHSAHQTVALSFMFQVSFAVNVAVQSEWVSSCSPLPVFYSCPALRVNTEGINDVRRCPAVGFGTHAVERFVFT